MVADILLAPEVLPHIFVFGRHLTLDIWPFFWMFSDSESMLYFPCTGALEEVSHFLIVYLQVAEIDKKIENIDLVVLNISRAYNFWAWKRTIPEDCTITFVLRWT